MYKQALEWALKQTVVTSEGDHIPLNENRVPHFIVEKVREYFNQHNIEYNTFSYDDLAPFLQQ
jgi:hypothetical protein